MFYKKKLNYSAQCSPKDCDLDFVPVESLDLDLELLRAWFTPPTINVQLAKL